MTYFLKSGNCYNVSSKEALDLHEKLPPGQYVVKFNDRTNSFFLEQIEQFIVSEKIYGDSHRKHHVFGFCTSGTIRS
jgi:hypothetical protein